MSNRKRETRATRWVSLGFGLALCGAGACSEYNREAVDNNNQGMSLMRANRLADAREKFQRAAEEDHRFDLPLYNLALSYIRARQWGDAQNALERAVSRAPNNPEYHYQLGNAHYQQALAQADSSEGGAHHEAARTSFRNALQRNQNLYMAHFRLGQIAEVLDDPHGAMEAYTACLRAAPRAYAAYARLGRQYLNNNLFNEAVQVLREGLAVAPEGVPERAQMWNVLGLTYQRQHQAPQAVEAWEHAIQEDPSLTVALFSLGMTYADMPDRRDQAVLRLSQFGRTNGAGAPPEFLAAANRRLTELQNPTGGAAPTP